MEGAARLSACPGPAARLGSGTMPHADHQNVSNAMTFLYDHPVSDDIRARVLSELADIERRHDVRVLFACESGSRGWGFASPDSDYDVRFVYVHRPVWYLSVEPQRDVIEVPISDELDVGGWELRKALQLMHRSNPTLLEWLASPIVYREDPDAARRMRTLAPTFFGAQGRWHYLSMAAKNFRGYLQGETVRLKKYLYVLRPLLAAQWIDAGRGMPPMRFADLADVMVTDRAAAPGNQSAAGHQDGIFGSGIRCQVSAHPRLCRAGTGRGGGADGFPARQRRPRGAGCVPPCIRDGGRPPSFLMRPTWARNEQ